MKEAFNITREEIQAVVKPDIALENACLYSAAEEQAEIDNLTKLFNRRAIERAL